MKVKKENLTEKNFWNDYWKNIRLPQIISTHFSFERCLSNYFKQSFKNFDKGTMIEIGCAPGKWMMFLENLGYRMYGIEYCVEAGLKTSANLKCNNSLSNVIIADFFNNPVKIKFDYVYSLGFIEHFAEPGNIILKHFDLVKPDGYVIIGVPNFRGINHMIQNYLDSEIIKAHNLCCMDKNFFESFAFQNNLDIISLNYIGSFEPALFICEKKASILKKILMKLIAVLFRMRNFSTILDNINSKYWSSYIICILKKRCD